MSIGVDLASVVDLVADIKDAERAYAGGVPARLREGFRDRGFAIEGRIRRKDFTGEGGVGVGEPPIGVVLGDLWKAVRVPVSFLDCG